MINAQRQRTFSSIVSICYLKLYVQKIPCFVFNYCTRCDLIILLLTDTFHDKTYVNLMQYQNNIKIKQKNVTKESACDTPTFQQNRDEKNRKNVRTIIVRRRYTLWSLFSIIGHGNIFKFRQPRAQFLAYSYPL